MRNQGKSSRLRGGKRSGLLAFSLLSASAITLAGCSFDPSTKRTGGDSPVDGDGAPIGSDGSVIFDAMDDALPPELCPDPLHAVLTVNGVDTAPVVGDPFVNVLLGDTVTLSAVGSCTQSAGTLSYTWSLPGTPSLSGTEAPGLDAQTITVYPTEPGAYDVQLLIDDQTNSPVSTSVFAIRANGFESLPYVTGTEVKDLHAGSDQLWIGAKDGAYHTSLVDPTNGATTYPDVDNSYNNGPGGTALPIPADVNAVFESAGGNFAWFSSDDADIYRADLVLGLTENGVSVHTARVGAKVKDIGGSGQTVIVGTTAGSATANATTATFTDQRDSPEMKAIIAGATGSFGGGGALYPTPGAEELDVFNAGDNKIRGFADDGSSLWIGSDANGVVRYQGGLVVGTFTTANSDLGDDKVRAIAVDSQGDIWVTTQTGVNRYKRDRQVWVPLPPSNVDLKAITIDEVGVPGASGSRRAIFVGGTAGLQMMRIATP